MMHFKELIMTLPPANVKILRAAAQDNVKSNFLTMCALYAPTLKQQDILPFLQFLKTGA